MDTKPLAEVQQKIKELRFEKPFDLIVAVARGGVIPAVMIQAHHGGDLEWIWLNFRDDDQKPNRERPELTKPLAFDPAGKSILVVDDRSRTGSTLNRAKEYLAGARYIQTLVVNGQADYVLFDEDCFYFPWRMDLPSVTENMIAKEPDHSFLDARLAFLVEIDKLKLVIRRNELADGSRRENTAEHSWHLVMFALTLVDHAAPGVDLGRVLKLCALHDLVEIDAGDTFFWDTKGYEDKEARERAAAKRLFGMLPAPQAAEFEALWEEFEAVQTPEALYANAVDRLAPVLLNSHSGGRSWRENGITADMIRDKMQVIAKASPALGRALETMIETAQKQGLLGGNRQVSQGVVQGTTP